MTVYVTGASRGIGKAIVEAFAEAGADVAFSARNLMHLQTLEASLKQRFPHQRFFPISADLSDKSLAISAANQAFEALGHCDVLVNNAGFFLPGGTLTEEDQTFEQMLNANVASAYHTTRVIAPKMQAAKAGSIFTICSTASIMAYVNGGSYCIAKHALLGFNKVLREELKPHGVRVTAVMPGATLTDSWSGTDLPESRFIPAEDIATAIVEVCRLSSRTVIEELLIRPQLGDI